MILACIQWWDSSSEALEGVEYLFITLKSTDIVVEPFWALSMVLIDVFAKY